MEQYSSGAKAMAWVEHILSLSPQVRKAGELEYLMGRPRPLINVGEPLGAMTRRLTESFLGYDLEAVRVHHGHQAEEASRQLGARAFTFMGHIFGPRQNLDESTREGLGLLAHELTHAIQQTQPHRLPQRQSVNRGDSPVPAAPPGGHSDVEMVLLSSTQSSPLAANLRQREAQAQANEQLLMGGLGNRGKPSPLINHEEVANRVYRLMQNDLVLERERATRLGG